MENKERMRKQDDKKHLKEQCEIDDEVQEITIDNTPMKKNRPLSLTCNQTFALKGGLKKISRKSTLSSCEILLEKCSEIETY